MIIFTSNVQLLPYIDNCMTYNLSSYYSGYESVSRLITKVSVCNNNSNIPINEFIYTPEFDVAYANNVFNDPELYIDFMKIVINSTMFNVVVLVEHDNYRDAITESLIKLIQMRYGYNCWSIDDFDDLESLKETGFSPQGLNILDMDKQRLDSMNVRVNNLIDME